MKVFKYTVKEDEIRNIEAVSRVLHKVISTHDPKETIFELDFGGIENPDNTMSTGIVFQRIAGAGVAKTLILNHKNKDKFTENPVVRQLVTRGAIEIR